MIRNVLRIARGFADKKPPNLSFKNMNIKKTESPTPAAQNASEPPKQFKNIQSTKSAASQSYKYQKQGAQAATASADNLTQQNASNPSFAGSTKQILSKFKVNPINPSPAEEKVAPVQRQPRVSKLGLLNKISDDPTPEHPEGELSWLYQQKIADFEEQKKVRSDYQYSELTRGEDGIDNTPVAPEYSVRLHKMMRQIKHARQELQKQTSDEKQMTRQSERLRQYRKEYETQARYNELKEFEQYIAKYPGSRRGPEPQDDPVAFEQYIRNRIPVGLRKELGLYEEKLQSNTNNTISKSSFVDENPLQDEFLEDNPFRNSSADEEIASNQPLKADQFDPETDHFEALDKPVLDHHWQAVPMLPNFQTRSYQQDWGVLHRWTKFRNYLNHQEMDKAVTKIFQNCAEASNHIDQEELIPKMGRLYNYYMTLPAQMRDHPVMKTLYLGLEYKSPDYTLQEKEEALNLMAYKLLPIDQVSTDFVESQIAHHRPHQPTPSEVEKIYNMKIEFTWDIHEFLDEVKEEQLRGETRIQEEEQHEFLKPKPKQDQSQLPNLPVQFYDNQDGFWSDYIASKNEVYEGVPIGRFRPYLKH